MSPPKGSTRQHARPHKRADRMATAARPYASVKVPRAVRPSGRRRPPTTTPGDRGWYACEPGPIEILEDPLSGTPTSAPSQPNAAAGSAAVEAPRGTLIHDYSTDAERAHHARQTHSWHTHNLDHEPS